MTFEYKNNIELDKLKKSSTISVLCNHCGLVKENCSVKNYINITSKMRKMNDIDEITGLYLCRKCSKKLQDTNKSIVEKANQSKDIFYSNSDNRRVHVCKDPVVKENLYKKMVITNKENFYWAAKRFGDRGKPFGTKGSSCIVAGLNYRMTDLEAAIGREQLRRLDKIRKGRFGIYTELKELFKKNLSAFSLWENLPGTEPNPWFCFVKMDRSRIKEANDTIAEALRAEGMYVGAHYTTPMTQSKWLVEKNTLGGSHLPWTLPGVRNVKYQGTCPNAERAIEDHLTFYMNESWKKQEVRDALKAFTKVEDYYIKR